MQKVGNPIPLFLDARGTLMDGGNIYVGVANGDPLSDPISAYWDAARTIVAAQPLRTIGGRIVNGVNPASVFVGEDDYSLRIEDANGVLVDYSPSVFLAGVSYQPLDSDLTAIASAGTSDYGRALLQLPNQAALVSATGIPAPLPAAGGAVTGNITRQGAGVHTYWADAAMTGGRIFITAAGAADPTSQPGDLWFTY